MCCAPSFGRLIADLDTIKQALSTYVTRLAGKLRQQGRVAGSVTVFIHTNRFRKNARQYYRTRSILLPAPTSSTAELNNYAQALLSELFAFGYEYKKIGVYVGGLLPATYQQEALFTWPRDPRLAKLDVIVDDLNDRFGRDRVRLAAVGYDKSWHLKQRWPTPCYTTRWSDIIQVK